MPGNRHWPRCSQRQTLQARADELATTKAGLAKAQSDANHAAALAVCNVQSERQRMQMTINRFSEQLSQVRALHIVQATKDQLAEYTAPIEAKKK